jgi:dipeptidyl aminopeptidase/acylaminoacyl peptidase
MLRAHEVPHEVIVFPDDVHAPLLHSRWLRIYRATADFFARHLRGGGVVNASDRRK